MAPPSPTTCDQATNKASNFFNVLPLPVCDANHPGDEGIQIDPSISADVDRVEGELERDRQDEIKVMTDAFQQDRYYSVAANKSILPRGVQKMIEERGLKEDETEFSWNYAAGAALPLVTLRKAGLPEPPKTGIKGPAPVRSAAAFQVIAGVAIVVMSDKLVDLALDKFGGYQSLRGPLQFLAPMAVYDAGYALRIVESPSIATFGRTMPILTTANWGHSHLLDAVGIKAGTDANTYGSMGLTIGSYVGLKELAKKSPQLATALFRGAGIRVSGANILTTSEMGFGARAGSFGLRAAGVIGAALMADTGIGWICDIQDEAEGNADPEAKIRIAARTAIVDRALCGNPDDAGPLSDDPLSPNYDPLYVRGFDPGIVGAVTCNMGVSKMAGRSLDGDEDMMSAVRPVIDFWLRSSEDFAKWFNGPDGVLAEMVLASAPDDKITKDDFWFNLESNLSHFYTEEKPTTLNGQYNLTGLTGFKSFDAKHITQMINSHGHIINQGELKNHLLSIVTERLQNTKGLFAKRMVALGLGRMDGERLVPVKLDSKDLNSDQKWFTYGDGIEPSERTRLRDEINRLQAVLKILNGN